jgi:iron complex transport system permease protein
MTRGRGVGAVVAAGIVATVLVAAASLCLGAVDVPFASVIQALTGLKPFGAHASERDLTVIYEMRLTRVLAGLCVGGALGGAGCVLQALLRNPLASPQAMSASNAAAFGAVGALFLGLPFAATLGAGFACAAVAVVLVLLFARSHEGVPTDSIVLSGLNMSLLFGAMTGLVQYAAKSDSQLRDMVLWLLGGLWRVTWGPLAVAGPLTVAALVVVFPLTRDLDLLAVGETDAARLGVNVKRSRVLLLVAACLLTALAVGLAGVVAFVGLVVPHAARKLVGASHRLAFPASVFLGAMLVVAADAVARTAFVPSELPLGVVTSIIGVPVFFVLMRSRRRGAIAR